MANTGSGGAVVIPSTIEGKTVTSIGELTFYNCSSLTSVTIGNSVTSIGEQAFRTCTNLTSVTIGNSVASIGDFTFYCCVNLTSVTIGNSVTSIGNTAFAYCTSLTSVTIPNSVASIDNYAFFQCRNLTNVMIGNSVTIIGNYTFSTCTNLTSVTIPNRVTSIGDYAFYFCPGLTSMTIPNSVTNIGNSAFRTCTSLTAITVDALNSAYSSVAGVLFNKSQTTLIQCPVGKAGGYTIGNSVTSIGDYAFYLCTNLTSVTIGDSVTSIGELAFYDCSNLTEVCFKGNAPGVAINVFNGASNVTVYYLPGTTGWGTTFGGRPTVLVNAPTGVSASDGMYSNKVQIVWNALSGSTSYEVWRYTSNSSDSASKISSPDPTGTSYDDTSAVAGTTYYYWVKAVLPVGAIGFSSSDSGFIGVVGPLITANGLVGDVYLNSGDTVMIAVQMMNIEPHLGVEVDWWVLAFAHSGEWYYLNSAMQWPTFSGNLAFCRPVYQGPLINLSSTLVLNGFTPPCGTYDFWFAIDYPMDGILNINGQILVDKVTIVVQ